MAAFSTITGALIAAVAGPTGDAPVLLTAWALVGIGAGFANAPLTTTAVSSLPVARAGVAAAITSTARQFGAALGIAAVGTIVTGISVPQVTAGSPLAWALVASCGAVLIGVALVSGRPPVGAPGPAPIPGR